jgi:hypothetical protein
VDAWLAVVTGTDLEGVPLVVALVLVPGLELGVGFGFATRLPLELDTVHPFSWASINTVQIWLAETHGQPADLLPYQ